MGRKCRRLWRIQDDDVHVQRGRLEWHLHYIVRRGVGDGRRDTVPVAVHSRLHSRAPRRQRGLRSGVRGNKEDRRQALRRQTHQITH